MSKHRQRNVQKIVDKLQFRKNTLAIERRRIEGRLKFMAEEVEELDAVLEPYQRELAKLKEENES